MKKRFGFSLMEMMVVMLIISIIAAASAPMVNKKMLQSVADKSPWVWTNGQNIAYNLNGDARIASIGSSSGESSRLYIHSNGTNPHMSFGATNNTGGTITYNLFANSNKLALTTENVSSASNLVAIGPGAKAEDNSVSIGVNSEANGENSMAIGCEARAEGADSISIGTDAAAGPSCIVFGHEATAGMSADRNSGTGSNAIAIGVGADADSSSVVIGNEANAAANSIAIGSYFKDADDEEYTTEALSANSIAIGCNAKARASNSIAIGKDATAGSMATSSVAIGAGAEANSPNTIVLGTSATTVYIPGNLIVSGHTALGTNFSSRVYLNIHKHGAAEQRTLRMLRAKDVDGPIEGSDGTFFDTTRQECAWANGIVTSSWATQTGWSTSDRRLKNVGEAFKAGLDEIKKLEVFHYTFKKDPNQTPRVGVMAQDLQKIFPDAVFKGEDGFLRIRMEDMFYAAINAIKEIADKILAHDKRIDELTKQNAELVSIIDQLEARLEELEK